MVTNLKAFSKMINKEKEITPSRMVTPTMDILLMIYFAAKVSTKPSKENSIKDSGKITWDTDRVFRFMLIKKNMKEHSMKTRSQDLVPFFTNVEISIVAIGLIIPTMVLENSRTVYRN